MRCKEKVVSCLDNLIFTAEKSGAGVVVVTENGNIGYHSSKAVAKMQLDTITQVQDLPFGRDFMQEVDSIFNTMESDVEPKHFNEILPTHDGETEVSLTLVPIISSDAKKVAVIIDQPFFHESDTLQERLVGQYVESGEDGTLLFDHGRKVIYANRKIHEILGVSNETKYQNLLEELFAILPEQSRESVLDAIKSHQKWSGEFVVNRALNTPDHIWLTLGTIRLGSEESNYFYLRLVNISHMVSIREELEFEATHDMLTGLPNRTLLLDRLEQSIRSMKRNGGRGALLFIDIDDFKEVNDQFGHDVGDILLKTVSERLGNSIRSSDTLGRYGGDEFLLIIENIFEFDEVILVIQKLRDQFAVPVEIKGVLLQMTFSIGVAMVPDDGHDARSLIDAADKAMYAVKQSGKDGFDFVKKEHSVISNEYFRIQRSTKEALKNRSFEIVYQPQFSIRDGRVTGAEALLRCTDESIKNLPIHKIIKVAEESGVIHDIGQFVFEAVSRQLAEWRDISVTPIRISINLSRKEIGDEHFEAMMRHEVEEKRVDPEEIEFEITESTLMNNTEKARKNIESLRSAGFQFSIDDFGTGYSSLSNLKEYNLDKLKIDKSFIDTLPADENDQAIVSATISMAKKLGLKVVAEGVETSTQDALLKILECDEVQGFYYSHPVHPGEMTQMLMARNA